MSTFTILNSVATISNLKISKVKKEGTNRILFKIEKDGKLITSTMVARLYDAKRVAKLYTQNN